MSPKFEPAGGLTNSVEPDQMLHSLDFNLAFHCVLRLVNWNTWFKCTLVLLNVDILFLCKQCRSRSVGF